jgi:hypothetical protein
MIQWCVALTCLSLQTADFTKVSVKPSLTDAAITSFDSDHTVFIDPNSTKRNEMVLYLPGTNGKTTNTDGFCGTAAKLGFHVINLMYPDDIPATVARNDSDPNAFRDFRLEIIEGGDRSKHLEVDRTNSIENRLIKLLGYLHKNRPGEKWDQFLRGSELAWDRIVVSGGSQGAGHACLIALRHKVARAVLFGGPKDFSRALSKPAAWYTKGETSPERFYTFNHKQDAQGCDYDEQRTICKLLGIAPEADVDTAKRPFGGAHALFTDYPGGALVSVRAHASVIGDGASPKMPDGSYRFAPVWEYMLTGK